MKTYTHAELMAEIVKRANAGTLDIQNDNEGQLIIYTDFFEQFDGTIGDTCDPKYADALENPEDYCDECGVEYPKDATSDIGEYHNENCSLHPVNQVSEALEGVDDPAV